MKQLQLQSSINYMGKFYCLRAFKISYQNAQITEELEKRKKERAIIYCENVSSQLLEK